MSEWKIEFSHINSNGNNVYMIVDEKGDAPFEFDYLSKEEAEKLVRRWNSFDDLLEACKGAVKTLILCNLAEAYDSLYIKLNAAIAKAEK